MNDTADSRDTGDRIDPDDTYDCHDTDDIADRVDSNDTADRIDQLRRSATAGGHTAIVRARRPAQSGGGVVVVYAVALSKGGSTKTTTAAEIVAALARRGRKVVAVDLDQQGNLTTRCGLERSAIVEAVAADVMTGAATALAAAVPAPSIPGALVVAGTHDLADLETRPEVITALRDHLPGLDVDDVVIDTPPAVGLLTLAALAAADKVVVSLACESESFDQLARLEAVLASRIAPRLNPGAAVDWIVPTRHDGRRRLDREVVELLTERHPGKVSTPVREAVAARDAYSAGMPVSIYAPTSAIAADYAAALTPLLDGAAGSAR